MPYSPRRSRPAPVATDQLNPRLSVQRLLMICLAFCAPLMLLPALQAFGQVLDKDRRPSRSQFTSPDGEEQDLVKQMQKRAEQLPSVQAVERAIDPATYRVGPGDVLRISFWGAGSDDVGILATVTPEGKLIIPTVGALEVNDNFLQHVQADIRRACEAKYDPRRMAVTVHLSQLRMVRAHVYGEVNQPGSYTGTAVDRVSQFLQQAQGWSDWADERHMEVRHTDGTADTLDMYLLYEEGDLAQDVFIRGGDVVYVPRIELTDKTAFVEGAVTLPGPHRIAKGETLQTFLYRVKALNRRANLSEIYFLRTNHPPQRVNLFADAVNGDDVRHLLLEHGDHIVVTGAKEFVYVHGAVRNPGNFPYVAGYKVTDYVGLAGGTEEMAGLSKTKIIRSDTGKTEKGLDKQVRVGDTLIVPVAARSTITQYLSIVSQIATILIAASAVGVIKK